MPRPQPPPSPRPRPRPGPVSCFLGGGGGSGGGGPPSYWSDSELSDDPDFSAVSEMPLESARPNLESEDSVSLDHYVYSPLADPHLDIRLVELLPGAFGETIRVRIHHVPLVEPELKEDPRIPVTTLAETCPEPWSVCRNLEGRALFWRREDDGAITTSWKHPDPGFDAAQYDLPPLENGNPHEPKFEALSYAWGSGAKYDSIMVQGDVDAKLAVTRSLLQALQHLRDGTQSRILWVDALCLNQEDTVEKSLQLPRMRDIYRLAYRVVVWLGTKSKRFQLGNGWDRDKILVLVFRELEYIAAQVEVSEDGASLWPSPDAIEKDWYRSDKLRGSASQDYQLTLDGLKQLLHSRWFRRLWVVQEIQLANKRPGPILQCGSYTITLSNFHRAIECLDLKTAKENHFRKTARDTPLMLEWPVLNAIRLLHPMSGVNHKIVLALNWNRKCRDDRDRVYGLLGLTSRQSSDQIQVRYDKATVEVYKDFFLRHLQLAGRLEILIDYPSTLGLWVNIPSWVPDWSAKSKSVADIKIQFAAYNTRAHFKHNKSSSDILEVCGVRCSVVNQLLDDVSVPYRGKIYEAVHEVRRWQPHGLDTAKYLPTGEPLRNAYLLTLLQGDTEDRWQSFGRVDLSLQKSSARVEPLQVRVPVNGPLSPEAWVHQDYNRPSLQKWVDQDYDHWLFERQSERTIEKRVPHTTPHPHVMRALSGCYGRRFFQTQEGYMGLAPSHTKSGDTIAILLGCLNPVILRPVRKDNDNLGSRLNYKYVGECFVHGLQDSTWLLGPLPYPWKSCMVRCPGMRMCLGFKNTETGVQTLEDPRLEAMDAWERFCPEEGNIPQHFPFEYCFFRNKETGEVITYDPRLERADLDARGIDLTWFSLI